MTLSVGQEAERLLDEQMQAGGYGSVDELIVAALTNLQQTQEAGEFAPGEWDALLAEAEESIRTEGTLDAQEAYEARRRERNSWV